MRSRCFSFSVSGNTGSFGAFGDFLSPLIPELFELGVKVVFHASRILA